MSNPKVSIIIPIYNVENYIEECAESLFKQTLCDIEFIFVNDCTPDKSMEKLASVLDRYPKRKQQVHIINHTTNLGAARARKNGILAATGEYIIHCDSDDWTDIHLYETLYNKAKSDNLDAVICEFYTIYGSKSKVVRHHLGINPLSTIIGNPLVCSLFNKLVRRTILTDNQITFPDNHMMEDAALCAQFFYFVKRIGYIDHPLYYYRIVPNSICHQESEESYLKRWKDAYANVRIIQSFLENHNSAKLYKEELILSKSNVRGFIWPLLRNNMKYYNQWYNTFPELNRQYLLAKNISFSMKLIFIITRLKAYPLVYRITHFLK